MKNITVFAPSGQYEVKIGRGLLFSLGREVSACTKAKRCVLVSGENVFPLYGSIVLESLKSAGLDAYPIVFPAGENTKCLQRYGELLEFLAEHTLTRSDCVVALGGGVTGDLAGFAASTFQRGIGFIQVPTTLLAAVDSSVGGKTAVNLPAGKNQVGTFYQPSLVLCDTDTLDTLPERERRAGFAEVIKYGVLGDKTMFSALENGKMDIADIIERCVQCKADIVAEDEHDLGKRRLLNLGHTFGHAVESRSSYSLLHGEAVSVGMAMISRAAVRKGVLEQHECTRILSLLQAFSLPTESPFSAAELYDTLLLDKKFSQGKLHLIVPHVIGHCEIVAVTPAELKEWLEASY
jgi:3-dehydroquinate synthase